MMPLRMHPMVKRRQLKLQDLEVDRGFGDSLLGPARSTVNPKTAQTQPWPGLHHPALGLSMQISCTPTYRKTWAPNPEPLGPKPIMTLNTRPCKLNLILLCRPAVDIRHVLHPTYSSELAEWPHKGGRYFQGEDQGLGLGFVGFRVHSELTFFM